MNDAPNNSQSADNVTPADTVLPMAEELGPNGLPVHPPQGEEPEQVDNSFIMDTFFGDGSAELKPNPASGQAQGSKEAGGQTETGKLAPQPSAPAANEGEGSPQPGSSPTPQPSNEQVREGEGSAQTPGQEGTPSPETPPPSQLSADDRLKLAQANALIETNRQLQERLAALESGKTQPQGGQGTQPAPSTQPGTEGEPPLRLVVPNELYDGIMSEDKQVSQQALSLLITGVAQNAVNAALAKVAPLVDQKLNEVTQSITATQKIGEMEEAYYSRFPSHKNPLLKQIIQATVEEKYKLIPNATWDEVMIDAVGQTVNQKLQGLGINPDALNGSGGQEPQPQPKPRLQPAPMLDTTNRGGGDGKVHEDAGDFIRNTFG